MPIFSQRPGNSRCFARSAADRRADLTRGSPAVTPGETLRYARVRGHNGRESRGVAAPNSSVTTYHVHAAFQACRYIGDGIRPLRVMHTRQGMMGHVAPRHVCAGAFLCAQDSKREMADASRASVTARLLRPRFTGNDLMALIS